MSTAAATFFKASVRMISFETWILCTIFVGSFLIWRLTHFTCESVKWVDVYINVCQGRLSVSLCLSFSLSLSLSLSLSHSLTHAHTRAHTHSHTYTHKRAYTHTHSLTQPLRLSIKSIGMNFKFSTSKMETLLEHYHI